MNSQPNYDFSAAVTAMDEFAARMVELANLVAKVISEVVMPRVRLIVDVFEALPIRLPGEHPVDYVMRVGPASGHTIHSDEAWRFRSRAEEWWGHSEKDRMADTMFHGEDEG